MFPIASRRSSGRFLAPAFFSLLALLLFGVLGAGTAAAGEAPVAAYSFDENSGSMAHDSIGTHDGNLKNGTTWSSTGKFGSAVHFDGIDDLITVPAAADLNLSKTFTVEIWVKPDELTPYDAVLTKEAGSNGTYNLIPEGNHAAPKAEVGKNATETNTINSTSQLPLNTWSHLALTSDGAYLRLYVNGTQVASVPNTTVYTGEGPTQIGGNVFLSGEHFKGFADEVRIYNRTLSGTEIGKDKETAIGWTKPRPVAAYSFDESSGSMAHDSIGTHDGNLKNGTAWLTPGKFGSAVHFDGVNDLITIPASADLNLGKNFTIEAWVRPDALTPYDSVLTKEAGTGMTYSLIPEGNHVAPKAEVAKNATEAGTINATSQLPLNTWSHLALTSSGEHLRLYVNGTQVASVPQSAVYTAEGATQIGGNIGGEYFNGYVDEVRIYNRTLSGTEIGKDKETAIGWAKPNPIAAYSFDEGSGSVAHDLIGANDGAFNNGTTWSSAGKFGSAVRFDGIDDLITIPAAANLNLGRNFTIETWVKPDALTPYDYVLVKEAGATATYALIPEGNHVAPKAEVAKNATEIGTINSTSQLPLNTWSHLALTSSGEYLRLFVNGTQVASIPQSSIYTGEGPTLIGGWDAMHFDGFVDEVRIYNRTLNNNEVSKDVTAALGAETPDTIIDTGPASNTKQTMPTITYHASTAGSTFYCAVDGGAYALCSSSGYTTAKLAEGPHVFSVRARSAAGFLDPSAATRSFTVDTTPPETTLEEGAEGLITNPTPVFEYSSSDESAIYECRIDAAAFEFCGDGFQQIEPPLGDGSHTFAVRAVDLAGNADATPATQSFTVDDTPPAVEILSGPSGPTNVSKPKYTFQASGQSALQCAVNSIGAEISEPTYGACAGSTYHEPAAALADGSYVVAAKVEDAAGNEVEEARVFTVDTKAPETTISSGPGGATDDSKPVFGFASAEAGSSFACRFDAEAFAACSGSAAAPKAALADGAHSFEVKATDAGGNVDATPAKGSFTVYTAAPQTKIESGLEGPTTDTTPPVTYSADETASFECRVDSNAFILCQKGGKELGVQAEGEHVFEVRARNAAGAVDPTPARRAFIVDVSSPSAPALGGEIFVQTGPSGLDLTIVAADGNRSAPATTRAGVESATLSIDGQQAVTLRNRCDAAGCPDELEREYQASPYKVGGTHAYKLVVRDPLGHERTTEWSRTISSSAVLMGRGGPCKSRVELTDSKKDENYEGKKDCPETIISHEGVKSIDGKGGDDIIIGGPGDEVIRGGEGNDTIRGARSNDELYGEEGDDFLYGGVGDDKPMKGGIGSDVLDGGPGADEAFGGGGDDILRGGQGSDILKGEEGTNTVSFADALSPGFDLKEANKVEGQRAAYTGVFVTTATETGGVSGHANNGSINDERGGFDTFSGVQKIVGSAFDDVIERPDASVAVWGGPGADIFRGGGSPNVMDARANVDLIEGSGERRINHLDRVEFGFQTSNAGSAVDLYVSGSSAKEVVTVDLQPGVAHFKFATDPKIEGPLFGCSGSGTAYDCPLLGTLGAVVIAGYGQKDELTIHGRNMLSQGSVILNGGAGIDTLNGGGAEEMLIDGRNQGSGSEREELNGGGGDDVLIQGGGRDRLRGGNDNDLLVSSAMCGDDLDGGKGSDNAQFHPFDSGPGVYADLRSGQQLGTRKQGKRGCSELAGVEDLEGSPQPDIFNGNATSNLLLGRGGRDVLISNKGKDNINAKDLRLDRRVDCSNDRRPLARLDKDIELINGKPKDGIVFCDRGQVTPLGPTYPDKKIDANALMASGAEADRIERLQEDEASAPPESEAPALDEEVVLASYEGLDAGGAAAFVASSGPQTGVEGGLLEGEGSAVALDGVDDSITLEEAPGLEEAAGPGFSLELLVKFAQAPGSKEYLYSTGSGTNGLFLYRNASGILTLAAGNDTSAPSVSTYTAVTDGGWHQVVAEVEDHALALYLDGMPARVGFGEEIAPELPSPEPEATLGVGPGQSGYLAGTVDEFSSYVGPLGESEVLGHLLETVVPVPSEVLVPEPVTSDQDGDGVADDVDNCPNLANASQTDADQNGIGDACLPPDIDGDEITDASDTCPQTVNLDQVDSDGDGVGDLCEAFAPEVEAAPATEVKAGSAILNGKIVPGGSQTTYRFEYGTTTSYGKLIPVPSASLPPGRAAVSVSRTPIGLTSLTTYHYRLVAESAAGRTESEDRTFTTP